jgi:hypothetical protein
MYAVADVEVQILEVGLVPFRPPLASLGSVQTGGIMTIKRYPKLVRVGEVS